jgi:hypothetical protein
LILLSKDDFKIKQPKLMGSSNEQHANPSGVDYDDLASALGVCEEDDSGNNDEEDEENINKKETKGEVKDLRKNSNRYYMKTDLKNNDENDDEEEDNKTTLLQPGVEMSFSTDNFSRRPEHSSPYTQGPTWSD